MLPDNAKEIVPGIIIFENVIEDPQNIINIAKGFESDWKPAHLTNNNVDTEYRNSENYVITTHLDSPTEWFDISKTVWQYGKLYSDYYEAPFSGMSNLQMLHYINNDGFYLDHVDDGPNNPRIFSSVLYLNDVKNGGETYFSRFDIKVEPVAGRLVMFPARFPYDHQALKPLSNDKYVIVGWFSTVIEQPTQ